MRKAGTITNKGDAARFGDYLLTKGIASRVDEESDGWGIWIIEEQHLETAKQEFEFFLANPADAKYQNSARSAQEIRKAEKKRADAATKNIIDPRERWQGRYTGRFPVTLGLIAISIAVAIFVGLENKDDNLAQWLYFAPLVQTPWEGITLLSSNAFEAIARGQVWRLVTPALMHANIMHIAFNLYMTFQLGALVESRRGSWRFLLIVLATAALSNIGQYVDGRYWGDIAPLVPKFLGMSGVVYGIFGYAWMKSRFDSSAGIFIAPNLVFWLILWLFICMTGKVGPIANTAHVIGLLTGMAIGYAPVGWRKLTR